jgi:archaellum component FlaG (FlaF/FlaG flagellin family)
MSGSCSAHDALDWFAAIGPTVAAAAAAWATWKTAQVAKQVGADSLALQRRIERPLLVVGNRLKVIRGRLGIHVIVELKNMGQSAANIESIRILVGGNEVATRTLEPTNEFWTRVINMLAPGEIQPLLDVTLEGDTTKLHEALRSLEVDIEYKAPWGDRSSLRTSVGRAIGKP